MSILNIGKLKIGLIAAGIPRIATGPAFWVKELSASLCDVGHEVTIVAGAGPESADSGTSPVAIDCRAKAILMPLHSRMLSEVHYNPRLKRWLHENIAGFDVVDIHGVWSFVAVHAARACMRAGIPYVLTPHGQMAAWDWNKEYWRKRAFFELGLRQVWRAAAAIHFVSEGEMTSSQIDAGNRAAVIPCWVSGPVRSGEDRRSPQLKTKLGIPETAPLIVFLGRISPQKGVLEIVRAFEQFWRSRRDPYLVIAGPPDGAYAAIVAREIEHLQSRHNIRIVSPMYDQSKFELLEAASVFITLSKNEGLPITVLEAMSCGMPVLITDRANLPEVESRGAGKIVSSEPLAVTTALESMLADSVELQRMSDRAKRLAAERFSSRAVMPQLIELYRRVNRNARRARSLTTAQPRLLHRV
jgi:glycosyltransferase involved in cell wall biosynthesis